MVDTRHSCQKILLLWPTHCYLCKISTVSENRIQTVGNAKTKTTFLEGRQTISFKGNRIDHFHHGVLSWQHGPSCSQYRKLFNGALFVRKHSPAEDIWRFTAWRRQLGTGASANLNAKEIYNIGTYYIVIERDWLRITVTERDWLW